MRSPGRALAATLLVVVAVAGCSVRTQPEPYAHGVYGSSPSNPMAEGTVAQIDNSQRVIVLDNGRMYQVPADSVVYVNGQPVTWTTVRPGTYVTLTNGQLVELRDGRYAIVQSPGAVVTPAPSTTVITPAPGTTTVVTQAPATTGVRQTIYGRITDVDRNEVRIKTEHGTFEMPIANPASSGIRKGDTVQLDVIISPTSPSALPRR
jgi:hypothetical protein